MKRIIRKYVRLIRAWWFYLSAEAQDGAKFLGQAFIIAVAASLFLKILIMVILYKK